MAVHLQEEPFDTGAWIDRLTAGRTDVGAVVSFTGLCRADGETGTIQAMTLEHYPGMAEEELGRLEDEARARWPLLDVLILHRYGRLVPGDPIVLVVTLSSHRAAAFAAADFVMDYLKTSAPFWKKEENERGPQWVEAKASDDAARDRW
ncbi:molybdenum cofactor biosynthesis protein MoaE [Terrihabitans rhizophilus]|uniref:Molybdopterin synthase catalytic subunit n=1 Tax=Terrihabitans rhizophilus TaxID=3092662 RepID=A0ABU4RQ88_9HYPH|nr:molybdenum cofactor biosynthesis protein MoaE [Terrihabitans sp. PJ23]MDX6807008.1 molybdenum cofactor biosynthesis protein MoaE [Terrihabitans sp. PJ23]